MTTLRPMRSESFPAYLEAAVIGYARENIAAGRWPEARAMERSREDILALLPHGVDTPDQHLFEILKGEDGPLVGFLWCAIQRRHGACTAFLYDIEVKPGFRRKGHASRALRALEEIAAALGATAMGLNVFNSNPGAGDLYRKLGYLPTNVNMRKPLAQDGD